MPASKGTRPPNAGKGRKPGVANKATRDVRAALTAFAEGNVEKLQTWLDAVAEKDPAKAADLFIRVLEYHVPKLARTELSGSDGSDKINVTVTFVGPQR
jgi:hypothetical protein